jgi:hypothetical protein
MDKDQIHCINLLFYGDLFNNLIIYHISIIDYCNLYLLNTKSYKYYKARFNACMCNKVIYRLKYVFDNLYEDLVKHMTKNVILTGSFLIQCLLNEDWNNSDIDFFVSTDNVEFTPNFCSLLLVNENAPKRHIYDDNLHDIESIEDYIMIPNSKIKYYNYVITNDKICYFIAEVSFYEPIYKVQVINVSKSNVINYIFGAFDFPVCKNVFYFSNNVPTLKIYNLNALINKIITSNEHNKRSEKYADRGFKIIYNMPDPISVEDEL